MFGLLLALLLPARLVAPAPFPAIVAQAPTISSVAPGVEQGDYELLTPDGPIAVHVVAIAPHRKDLHLAAVLATDHLTSPGETVLSMARRTGAVAAINGDYFDIDNTNQPTNVLIRNGRLLRTPRRRYAIAIDTDGTPRFAEFSFTGTVMVGTNSVALDAVNGAGAVMTPHFLRDELDCELHAISIDPEKPFPRIAEPRPDTLLDLSKLVVDKKCDIGFGQDPDGDRLAVADETGRVLDNDDVLAIAVDAVLARRKGPVVVNLTTSMVIDDVAAAHGVAVHRTPVGEANVVESMLACGAVIGGEGGNGGVIFPAVQHCRDSYAGMALWLDRLASSRQSVSQLAAALPRYYRRSATVALEHGWLGSLMQRLAAQWPEAQLDRRDGLKLMLKGEWIHARASNTEPILRLSVEAKTETRAEELFTRAQELLSLSVPTPAK